MNYSVRHKWGMHLVPALHIHTIGLRYQPSYQWSPASTRLMTITSFYSLILRSSIGKNQKRKLMPHCHLNYFITTNKMPSEVVLFYRMLRKINFRSS